MSTEYNTASGDINPERQQNCAFSAPGPDFITRMSALGGVLTKQWCRKVGRREPECIPYPKISRFNARMVPVTGLTDLANVLDNLTPRQAVIHGALVDRELGELAQDIPRWLYPREDGPATLKEGEHYWVLMDVDNISAPEGLDPIAEPQRAASYVISLLPKEFHSAAHWWQLTGSAGFRPGIRMRLAFWMDRRLATSDVNIWLSKVDGLDLSIYTANQLVYAAAPLFKDGIKDPVPRRSGLCEGAVVSPPEIKRPPDPCKSNRKVSCAGQREPAPVPDNLKESDDDPRLLTEGRWRRVNFHKARGYGTTTLGGHVRDLVQWLGDMGTRDGLIASAEMIAGILEDDYATPVHEIERLLTFRWHPRGWDVIDPAPKLPWDDDEGEDQGVEELANAA